MDAVCKPLRVCIKVVCVNEKGCVRVIICGDVCIKVVCVNEKWYVRVIILCVCIKVVCVHEK